MQTIRQLSPIETAGSRQLLSGINAINAPTYRPDISSRCSIGDRVYANRVCKLPMGYVKHHVNTETPLTQKFAWMYKYKAARGGELIFSKFRVGFMIKYARLA